MPGVIIHAPGMDRTRALLTMARSTNSGDWLNNLTVICAPSESPTTNALPP